MARHVLHVGSQGVFGLRNMLANNVDVRTTRTTAGMYLRSWRLIRHEVARLSKYSPLILATQHLFRPVKWCDERSDGFVSDQHGRDSVAVAELALAADGAIIAGRLQVLCNNGGYLSLGGPSMHTRNIPRNFPGPYRLPALFANTHAVFINTIPMVHIVGQDALTVSITWSACSIRPLMS